jgi:hypothetical protein
VTKNKLTAKQRKLRNYNSKFEVLTAVPIKIAVFLDVISCSLAPLYLEIRDSIFHTETSVGKLLPGCMASYRRGQ